MIMKELLNSCIKLSNFDIVESLKSKLLFFGDIMLSFRITISKEDGEFVLVRIDE